MTDITLSDCLDTMPLVAVLRGIEPNEALAVGQVLLDAGFKIMEVTLNSPSPLDSIRILADAYGDKALVGAGTVLTTQAAKDVADAGGRLVVMPHSDGEVIKAGKANGCYVLPGVATPTEAFAALNAGADGLKMFPAESMPPSVLKAWRAVLPKDTPILPVGSMTPETMPSYWAVGANGFGLGSALYKNGKSLDDLKQAAEGYVRAMNALKG